MPVPWQHFLGRTAHRLRASALVGSSSRQLQDRSRHSRGSDVSQGELLLGARYGAPHERPHQHPGLGSVAAGWLAAESPVMVLAPHWTEGPVTVNIPSPVAPVT